MFLAVDAVQAAAQERPRRFTETMEVAMKLGVDPRKPNQSVRGTVILPHGTGKAVRVAVFAKGDAATEATEAGAHRVGAEDLAEEIQAGNIDFDVVVASPDMMGVVSRVARVLGPRGLMPNAKLGTVSRDVAGAVRASMAGRVEFRAHKDGMVMAGLGKVDFTHEQLLDNLRAFMIAIGTAKPEGSKGKYIHQVHLSSTMGPGVPVSVPTVDPTSSKFFIVSPDEKEELKQRRAEREQKRLAAAAAAAEQETA